MITKPAVSGQPPITLSATGVAISNGCELIAVHYLNLTEGVGRVDIYDGLAIPANLRITLGAAAQNGTDDFSPAQPMKFFNQVRVVFTTGTGVVTLLSN
jgi:hypothetical protein